MTALVTSLQFMSPAKLTGRVLDLPRPIKRLIALGLDAALCVGSVWLAFYLRLGIWPHPVQGPLEPMMTSMAIALPIFVSFGLYRAIFRYAGWHALMTIVRAVAIYGIVFATIYSVIGINGTPRTVGLIQPILLLLLVTSSRLCARTLFAESYTSLWRDTEQRVLVYGAGKAGRELASTIEVSRDMKLVGFIDDDRTMTRAQLMGVTIFPPEELARIVRSRRVTEVLLAIPSATVQRRTEILGDLKGLGLHVRTLPSMSDIARGKISVGSLKEVEISDLLGRPMVPPDLQLLNKTISGRTVLVTGAGGSIGSELCRQIATNAPARLLLLDHSEFNLYAIHQELERLSSTLDNPLELVPLLGSVGDRVRLEHVFARYPVDSVFHAAAYKHVPMVEQNLVEGIRNNTFGTLTLAQVAARKGVADFVLISTDKAVRPTNAMGAAKRCAEMIIQALDEVEPGTRFSMVRFGNVLGSSGSVVPLFRAQVAAGGPVTLTHADITRYFMTIPEAAQLVLHAGAMASGGEVFVLDMGEPVRILDLARSIIELSGRSVRDAGHPEGDIEIRLTGLRPGEKLHEELLIGGETIPTSYPRILRSRERYLKWEELEPLLSELLLTLRANDGEGTRAALRRIVPEYVPSSPMADLLAPLGDAELLGEGRAEISAEYGQRVQGGLPG